MASYTVTGPALAVHNKTLVASTADTVTFDRALTQVEVCSLDGTDAIYFSVDGSAPTVGGASTYVMPAAIGARTVSVAPARPSGGGARSSVVKLISVGTPTYSVSEA